MRRLLYRLDTTDVVNIIFFMLLTVGMVFCANTVSPWWIFAGINFGVIISIFFLADFASSKSHKWKLFHGFYMMICIPIAFKEMYYLVPVLHPVDYDASLIAIDMWLFGTHPTVWLNQYSHPILTEILQIAYASFYFLPLILVVDLYRKKRMRAFKVVFLTVIIGFYLSYLGYVTVPAVGPRFILHDYHSINQELPGLFLTNALRIYTDTGESIPKGTENVQTKVQRDVFPSGHTEVTILVIFLAFRYRARTRWVLGIIGSLLIIATVYLRYHYVIDLIGGALFAILTIEVMKIVDSYWYFARKRYMPK